MRYFYDKEDLLNYLLMRGFGERTIKFVEDAIDLDHINETMDNDFYLDCLIYGWDQFIDDEKSISCLEETDWNVYINFIDPWYLNRINQSFTRNNLPYFV